MVKADIYLQIGLWYATNELRGAVTENYDKNYILPLVSQNTEVSAMRCNVMNYSTTDTKEITYRFQY